MSQIDDDIMDRAELVELRDEILELLDHTDGGLSSEDIFKKSQIAGEKKEVSQSLGGLRTGGYISATETDGTKVYVLTPKGKGNLRHEESPDKQRRTIELPAPVAKPVVAEKPEAEKRSKPVVTAATQSAAGKIVAKPHAEEKGKLAMVPTIPSHKFRCMLTSESSLIIEIPSDSSDKSQKVELTEDQVHVLWEYMARIYPNLIRVETEVKTAEK